MTSVALTGVCLAIVDVGRLQMLHAHFEGLSCYVLCEVAQMQRVGAPLKGLSCNCVMLGC